jgi:hypothetical protein
MLTVMLLLSVMVAPPPSPNRPIRAEEFVGCWRINDDLYQFSADGTCRETIANATHVGGVVWFNERAWSYKDGVLMLGRLGPGGESGHMLVARHPGGGFRLYGEPDNGVLRRTQAPVAVKEGKDARAGSRDGHRGGARP